MSVLAYFAFIGAIVLNFIIKNKKFYFGFLFLFMAVIVGIRGPYTGTDTFMYHELTNIVKKEGLVSAEQSDVSVEIGYRILMFFCGEILDSSQCLIFITAIITYLLFARYLYRNSDEKYYYMAGVLFIGMGFFCESVNAIRQLLALSIAVNGLDYLKNNLYVRAIIIIVLSCFIHTSMIMLITLVIFYMIADRLVKKDGNSIIMFFSSLFLIMFIGINIISIINNNIDFLGRYAVYYLRTEYSIASDSGGWTRIMGILIMTLMYSFFRFNKSDRVYNMMLILGCEFAVIMMYFTNTWMIIFYRFYYEFFIFFVILLINSLRKINSPMINIGFQIFLILISAINLYIQLEAGSDLSYDIFF